MDHTLRKTSHRTRANQFKIRYKLIDEDLIALAHIQTYCIVHNRRTVTHLLSSFLSPSQRLNLSFAFSLCSGLRKFQTFLKGFRSAAASRTTAKNRDEDDLMKEVLQKKYSGGTMVGN